MAEQMVAILAEPMDEAEPMDAHEGMNKPAEVLSHIWAQLESDTLRALWKLKAAQNTILQQVSLFISGTPYIPVPKLALAVMKLPSTPPLHASLLYKLTQK
jgi:hypothetical protein